MKAIIVDDEPKAIRLIESYLDHFSQVEVVATFRNGLKAFEYLQSYSADLIFLDIDMPHISGLSLSRMLDRDIRIVFTTAYSEFAVESYEVHAVDYLLKPITLERFMTAMAKVMEQTAPRDQSAPEFIWLKSGGKIHKVRPDAIRYLEKDGNYMIYHTGDGQIVARESVAEALENLPEAFCRVHKSYIVNTGMITALDRESVTVIGKEIPVSSTYVNALRKKLPNFRSDT